MKPEISTASIGSHKSTWKKWTVVIVALSFAVGVPILLVGTNDDISKTSTDSSRPIDYSQSQSHKSPLLGQDRLKEASATTDRGMLEQS